MELKYFFHTLSAQIVAKDVHAKTCVELLPLSTPTTLIQRENPCTWIQTVLSIMAQCSPGDGEAQMSYARTSFATPIWSTCHVLHLLDEDPRATWEQMKTWLLEHVPINSNMVMCARLHGLRHAGLMAEYACQRNTTPGSCNACSPD